MSAIVLPGCSAQSGNTGNEAETNTGSETKESTETSGENEADNETAQEVSSATEDAGSEAVGEGYKVGVIMANLSNSNYIDQANIYQEYLKSKGFEVMLTDCDNNITTMVSAAENFATMGCDALIFSPMDPDEAVSSAVEAARSVNPDIVVVNSVNDVPEVDFNVTQDEYDAAYQIGVRAGEWVNENQGGSGEVGIIAIFGGALLTRVDGFKAGVTDTVTGEVTFNEQTFDRAGGRTGYEIMEDYLMGFPDIKCVFGAADAMAIGAFEALKASDKDPSEYAFYGLDGTLDGLNALKEKSAFLGTVDNGSSALAYAISDVMIRLTVDKVPADSFTVTIPAVVVDQTNVDGFAYDYSWVEFTEK